MKTFKFRFIFVVVFMLLVALSVITATNIDSTQVRYVKFATTVSEDYTRVKLEEIKVLYDGDNIAQSKSITTNSNTYDYNTGKIVDGNLTTGWESDDYNSLTSDNGYGPTANNPHYIIVDLSTTYNLESLILNIDAMNFDYTFDFLVSADATNWTLVDHKDNTHGVYTYTNIPIQNVRYIKYACYSSSDLGQVNVQEIQAYSNGVNVALNKSVTANSYEWGDAATNGINVVDGSTDSRWSSNRNDHVSGTRAETAPVNVTIDLGEVQSVDSLQLEYHSATTFTMSISTDGNNWLQIDQRLNDKNQYTYVLNHSIKISSNIATYTANTATINANVTFKGSSNIIERGVCWGTAPNPTILDNKQVNGSGLGTYSSTITNLNSSTLYYVRAYATNATETRYSKEQSFLCGLKVETDVVSYNGSTAISGGCISAINSIEITERGVCWSTTSSPTIANFVSSGGNGVGEFSSTLTGLISDAKYYVRAYATTPLGTFYGKVYSFTHKVNKFQTTNGFFDGEVFSENGTYNNQPYYLGLSGNYILFDGSSWVISDFVSSTESGNPPLTGWWDGTELTPIIIQKASVTFGKSSLKESSLNNGSFKNTINITHDNVNGTSFTGTDNEDFVATGKAIVRNLPNGLTAKIVRNNSLMLVFSITGYATTHANANDVSNVKIMFLPDAFTDGSSLVTNGNLTNISLDFIEPVDLTVTGTKTCADYTITADNNVTLDNNSTLTINSVTSANQIILNPGSKLNLSNSVTVGDVVLKADDSNSFSAKLNTCMTVNGTVTFQKTMLDSKWYFLSFPCDVNVADITMLGGGTVDTDFYILTYDGANRATNGLGANWSHITTGTLEAKKGYAFGLKTGIGTKTLSFLLNKTIAECETAATVPATFYDGSLGNNHKGWNLIGQPYLSKFSGSDVGINYLTTWNGSAYVGQAKNLVESINPFEAFFVQVAATNPISFSLNGRQAVRSAVSQNLQESIQLNMTNAGGNDFSTLIFDNELSSDYEIGYDLEKWITTAAEKPQIYCQLNGIKYAYNALPISNATNLPIGYYSKNGGASTISASNVAVAGLSKLLLIDNQTNATTDLLTESYSFVADAGTNNSRFSIVPQRISTNNTDKLAGDKPYAFVLNSKLTISNLTANSTIRLYDATGKMLHTTTTNGNKSYEIALKSTGMYVVQIDSNTGSWNYKLAAN